MTHSQTNHDALSLRLSLVEDQIREIKDTQKDHFAMTAELLELFEDGKTAVRFVILAGKVALWAAKVFAAFGILWAGIKGLHFVFGGKP